MSRFSTALARLAFGLSCLALTGLVSVVAAQPVQLPPPPPPPIQIHGTCTNPNCEKSINRFAGIPPFDGFRLTNQFQDLLADPALKQDLRELPRGASIRITVSAEPDLHGPQAREQIQKRTAALNKAIAKAGLSLKKIKAFPAKVPE